MYVVLYQLETLSVRCFAGVCEMTQELYKTPIKVVCAETSRLFCFANVYDADICYVYHGYNVHSLHQDFVYWRFCIFNISLY